MTSTSASSARKKGGPLPYGAWVLPEELLFGPDSQILEASMDVSFLTGSKINTPKEWLPVFLSEGTKLFSALTLHDMDVQRGDQASTEKYMELSSFQVLSELIRALREPDDHISQPYTEPIVRLDGFLHLKFGSGTHPEEEAPCTGVSFQLCLATLIISDFAPSVFRKYS